MNSSDNISPNFGPGRRVALVVGANGSGKLKNLGQLKHAERDANDFVSVLSHYCGFELYQCLTGENAKSDPIKYHIREIIKSLSEEDVFLFYFSGHGVPLQMDSRGKFEIFLVTRDFNVEDIEIEENSHISLSYLRKMMYIQAKARQVIVILDCCFSGEYGRSGEDMQLKKIESLIADYFGEQSRESGIRTNCLRQALTATRHDSGATEQDGYSMTSLMLQALRGEIHEGVADGDGYILLNNLWGYLNAHDKMQQQKPSLPGDPAGQIFKIAWHSHLTRAARQQAAEDRSAIDIKKHIDNVFNKEIKPYIERLNKLDEVVRTAIEFNVRQDPLYLFDRSLCEGSNFEDIFTDTMRRFYSVERVFKQYEYDQSMSLEKMSEKFGFIRGGKATYGALICFSDNPMIWVPGAFVRCAVYPGENRIDRPVEDDRYTGSLISQFSEVNSFLRKHLRLNRVISEDGGKDLWEIPFPVLREALANAFVHREYSDRYDGISVNIFRDRVEITSPGHLIGGLTVEDLYTDGDGPLRNSLIARIFYIQGYVETLGSGVLRIHRELQTAQLPEEEISPITEKALTKFRVVIYRPRQEQPIIDTARTVVVGNIVENAGLEQSILQVLQGISARADLPPAVSVDQALALLAELPLDTIPPVQTLPNPHRMELPPNPLFVGRADHLRAIAQLLKAGGSVAITTGIGGMGKTQLAIEVAHRYGHFFAGGVFWINCADPSHIASEVMKCGLVMGLFREADNLSLDEQVARVRIAWDSALPRLLIFDNCEDETTLRRWRPTTGACRILVTSRRSHWSTGLNVVTQALDGLTLADSIALLRKHRPDLSSEDAAAVSTELGGLPLALHLAGQYLDHYRTIEPAAYLAKLRSSALFEHPSLTGHGVDVLPTQSEPHVARAFAFSFKQLDSANDCDRLARQLLARAACFAPGEPFLKILLGATVDLAGDEEMRGLALTDALARLTSLGLLEEEAFDQLRLHRLLGIYAAAALSDDAALTAVEQVIVSAADQANATGKPLIMQPLLTHLRYLVSQAHSFQRSDALAASLYTALGVYLKLVSVYPEAQQLCQWALEIRQRVLGAEHPDTAISLNNLAELYQLQGRYDQALPFYQHVLEIREQVLGPDHSDTAVSLNNLAWMYSAQGDYHRAEPLYKRALAITERVLGADHPDRAAHMNNLAELYRIQGQYDKALPLYHQALAINEQTQGLNHPSTAASLNNLALLYSTQGAYAEAEPLYHRAVEIWEKELGPDHPNMIATLNNLAKLYEAQAAYPTAERLYLRAREIAERVLGAEHRDTALSLSNLATLYYAQGDYVTAEPLLKRTLAIFQQVLGPEHPDTATSLNNLAALYRVRGDYERAEPLYREALEIAERVLGSNHPSIANSLNSLANLYYKQERFETALPLLERALRIYEQVLGPMHLDTALALHNLAEAHRGQNQLALALPLYERALEILSQLVRLDHPYTQQVRTNMELALRSLQASEHPSADVEQQ